MVERLKVSDELFKRQFKKFQEEFGSKQDGYTRTQRESLLITAKWEKNHEVFMVKQASTTRIIQEIVERQKASDR